MVRFVCPSCGTAPDATEEWVRVRSAGTDGTPPTVQLLLEPDPEPSESAVTEEAMESMRTLRPCGHTFPDASVHAVLRLLNVLETLLERHNDATAPLETQCLRREIHSVGRRLDAVAQQCAERSEPITPVRHQQWRSEERSGIPERNSRIQ